MKTIFIILSANGEYCDYDIYRGIVENVTDEIIQKHTGYIIDAICRHETNEGIYVGYLPDDEGMIADFNNYIAEGNYRSAYYDCTYCSIFFKKETI